MDGRLVGLLLMVTVMTTGARWLHSEEADTAEARTDITSRAPARPTALAAAATPSRELDRPAPRDTPDDDRDLRPASAALCLALQDKLRTLYVRASGESLSEPELRTLRDERRRAQGQLADLRCAGGVRAWF